MAVPDGIGINDHVWPVLALIKTSGFVGANYPVQLVFRQLLLQSLLQFAFPSWIAASPRVAGFARVGTNKDMFAEFWHASRLQQELREDDLGNHRRWVNAGVGEAGRLRAGDFVGVGDTSGLS